MVENTENEDGTRSSQISIVQDNADDSPHGLVRNLTASQVAVGSFLVASGTYGFLAAQYGNAAADVASTSPYPADAWLFFLLGVSLGVGMSAWIVATRDCEMNDSEVAD
jgi:hypothetical protein